MARARKTALMLVVIGAVLMAAGCSKRAAMEPSAGMAAAPEAKNAVAQMAVRGEQEAPAQVLSKAGAAYADAARKLIRTAQLDAEVDDAREAMQAAEEIARDAGGFMGDTSLERYDDGTLTCTTTMRVPVAQFEAAVAAVEKLGRVQRLTTGTQDVTADYVDLEARIRNEKREEEELLRLLKRGGRLADIVTVEGKLFEVRETIERHEGQMRVLKDQVSLSTITASFSERGEAAVAQAAKYDVRYHLRGAMRSLGLVLRGLATLAIYLLVVGWIVWLPLVLVVVWARRRQARRTAQAGPPADQRVEE